MLTDPINKGLKSVPGLSAAVLQGLMLVAAVLLLAGCGSKIQDTGTLAGGYDAFNRVDERTMGLRFLNSSPSPAHAAQDGLPALFVVLPPEWRATKALEKAPEARQEVLFTVRERLYRYLLRAYPHPVRVRYNLRNDDPLLEGHRLYVIQPWITDAEEGSGLLRYLVGYVGHARLQIEATMYSDLQKTQPAGEFVLRYGHPGYAQQGWNWEVLRPEYAMKYAAELAVRRLTEILPEHLPGVAGVDGEPPAALSFSQPEGRNGES